MFACIPCALCFESSKVQYEHTKSDFHAYNLRRRVAGDEPLLKTEFDLRQKILSETYAKPDKIKNEKIKANQPGTKTVYSPLRSLFCNHMSSTVNENLIFLKQRYNFQFYEPSAVRDPESLLQLLGDMIYNQFRCIWCDRQFKNFQAVQTHMSDKGHRRQGLMFEEQLESYRPFYNASAGKSKLCCNTTTSCATDPTTNQGDDDDWEIVGETSAVDDDAVTEKTSAYEILSPRTPGSIPSPKPEGQQPSASQAPKPSTEPETNKLAIHPSAANLRNRQSQRTHALAILMNAKATYCPDHTAAHSQLKQKHRLLCAARMRRQNFNTRMRKKRIFAV